MNEKLYLKYLVLKLSKSVDIKSLNERLEILLKNTNQEIITWGNIANLLLRCELKE